MTELKTEQALLDKLHKAAKAPSSSDQLDRQRVSFIMGTLDRDSGVTRARVSEVLAAHEGKTVAK